ncbi:MAG: o-succinylbenzoate synthase [Actinomyces sp.]|uniref:o-succinylbenzoate synthase n=1 Tax=Actinomyces sp. TaxID=29317 RepID=UPI0026DAD61A|nr:o-succinylbenzoate synthase [Actinomyces sp.]MDO4242163.1 o-succinylbenzoate synthase [Actinomyces sp.]
MTSHFLEHTFDAKSIRGEIDLLALHASDRAGILDGIDRAVVWDVALTTRFRGITRRDGVLLHGPGGWGEVAPFWDYGPEEAAPWLASALDSAVRGHDDLPCHRDSVPVNVTVPEVDEVSAHALVLSSGATTAKVKVGACRTVRGSALADDLHRLAAVRDALGPSGRIRIDVNGAWDLETARANVPLLNAAAKGLEYVEQPCASVEDMAALRRVVDVPIAADESIRLSDDPLAVARLEAADVAVLKVAPLGGVHRALALAERLEMPVVVSSALDTSVGIAAGAALAAALPELDHACGLGTVSMLTRDVAVPSAAPVRGSLAVRPAHVSKALLGSTLADAEVTGHWQVRLSHLVAALTARREREAWGPATAVAGLPL